jgi:hypothetical protein
MNSSQPHAQRESAPLDRGSAGLQLADARNDMATERAGWADGLSEWRGVLDAAGAPELIESARNLELRS